MAKQKSWNNYYEIIDELGEGGNAKAYRVKCRICFKRFSCWWERETQSLC